jgi:flagellar protein FlaG
MSFLSAVVNSASGGDMNISSVSSSATAAIQPSESKQPTPAQKALIQAVKTVNAAQLFGQENELTFIIDRAANIAVVRIVNKKTGEVVQQIPTEQLLKMAEESSGR